MRCCGGPKRARLLACERERERERGKKRVRVTLSIRDESRMKYREKFAMSNEEIDYLARNCVCHRVFIYRLTMGTLSLSCVARDRCIDTGINESRSISDDE